MDRITQDAQGRTVVTVVAVGRYGPAVERKLRTQASSLAYDAGFSRVRKIRTVTAPKSILVEYVAYRPRALDEAPQEGVE